MDPEWSHVVIELLGLAGIAFGFIWAIKSDTKVLRVRLDVMDKRLGKMETVIEALSNQKSRLDVVDERLLAQGKRVDENTKFIFDWIKSTYEPRHEEIRRRLNHLEILVPDKE